MLVDVIFNDSQSGCDFWMSEKLRGQSQIVFIGLWKYDFQPHDSRDRYTYDFDWSVSAHKKLRNFVRCANGGGQADQLEVASNHQPKSFKSPCQLASSFPVCDLVHFI